MPRTLATRTNRADAAAAATTGHPNPTPTADPATRHPAVARPMHQRTVTRANRAGSAIGSRLDQMGAGAAGSGGRRSLRWTAWPAVARPADPSPVPQARATRTNQTGVGAAGSGGRWNLGRAACRVGWHLAGVWPAFRVWVRRAGRAGSATGRRLGPAGVAAAESGGRRGVWASGRWGTRVPLRLGECAAGAEGPWSVPWADGRGARARSVASPVGGLLRLARARALRAWAGPGAGERQRTVPTVRRALPVEGAFQKADVVTSPERAGARTGFRMLWAVHRPAGSVVPGRWAGVGPLGPWNALWADGRVVGTAAHSGGPGGVEGGPEGL